MMKTVLQIVVEYLQERRYDGLCNPDEKCGCGLADIVPCGNLGDDCRPAIEVQVGSGGTTYIPVE